MDRKFECSVCISKSQNQQEINQIDETNNVFLEDLEELTVSTIWGTQLMMMEAVS